MREETRSACRRRLSRIAGQVNGVERMVQEGRDCVKILEQVAAVRAAVDQFGLVVLSEHLESCMHRGGGHEPDLTEEIKLALTQFLDPHAPTLDSSEREA